MRAERETEIRSLVRAIADWRNERARLTDSIANIAANPKKLYLTGKNPSTEIDEIKKRIVEGNASSASKKLRVRALLQHEVDEFLATTSAATAAQHPLRAAAADGLRKFLQNWEQLDKSGDSNRDVMVTFNSFVASVERDAVDGGEGALPKILESMCPNRRPGFNWNFVSVGKVEEALAQMLGILGG